MKRQGFTLIELLAVIVILSIILLIAVPIVLKVIKDSKKESAKDSIELYGRAVEQAVANYFMQNPDENSVTLEELEREGLIEYKGSESKKRKVECKETQISNMKVYLSDCTLGGKTVDYTYGEIDETHNMLRKFKVSSFLDTSVDPKKIKTLTIHTEDINIPDGYQSKDCSYSEDESVICYWKENSIDSGYYDMHIAAKGEIYTPYNSRSLFAELGYEKMTSLDLTGINTKYTTIMLQMFHTTGYNSLKNLNLGDKFDTSNVTNMQYMFYDTGFNVMTSLDLGDKFDTSKVENMSNMFVGIGRNSMTELRLGKKFVINDDADTSSMFMMCAKDSDETRIIVGSQELKNKILNSAEDMDVPSIWETNTNIIEVQE